MADVNLTIKANLSNRAAEDIKKQIRSAIEAVEKEQFKINIKFDISSIRKVINDLSSALATIEKSMAGGVSTGSSSASIKELTTATNALTEATNKYNTVSKTSGGKNNSSNINADTTAYNNYTKALEKAVSMLEKYSAAKNSSSPETRAAYASIEDQISELQRLYEELQTSGKGEEAFAEGVDKVRNALAQIDAQISHTSDNWNQNAEVARQAAEAEKEIANAVKEAQSSLQAYSAAQQSSNEAVSQAYNLYENAISGMNELKSALSEGSISADEARDKMAQYQSQIEYAKTTLEGFIQGQEQAAQAQREIASAIQEAESGLQAYAAAQQSSNEAVSQAYSSYENAINGMNELSNALSEGSIGADEAREKMSAYQEQINSAKTTLDGYIQEEERASQAAKELAQSQRDGESAMKSSANAIKNAESMLTRYSAAANSSSEEARNAYRGIEEELEKLNRYQKEYQSGQMNGTEFKSQVQQSQAQLKAYEQQIISTGNATKSLGDRFAGLASKFAMWFSASQAIMLAIRSMRELVSASIEVDSAMAQLKIVTDETDESYKQFADDIAQTAQDIGASITDLVDSATTYARLGYNMEESSVLAEYTSMLKNVGDIQVDEAQEAVTSIVKAFNVGVDDIEEVMDKLVAVGNNYPISVSEIAEGMTNTSSTLAAAGNSLEESIALLTAANTTIQNVSRSSTGLRTIVARLRNTTTELDELGEDMTEAKYEELISALTDANVALTDQNGEYRATYDIMKDIAHEWENLTTTEQAALAQTIAGTRQQAVFYSLVEQFQEAEGAMDTMAASAGTLTDSYDIYMDTTQRHIDTFKAAFQELGSDLFQTSFMNGLVDLGTGIVNVLDKVVELINKIGGLKTVIIALGVAIVALKFNSIVNSMQRFVQSIQLAMNSIKTFVNVLRGVGPSMNTFTQSINGVQTQVSSLPSALSQISGSTVAAIAGITGGIIALVATIEYVAHASDRAAEAASEAISEYQSQQETVNSLTSEYENLQEQIAELESLKASGEANLEQEAELETLLQQNDALEQQIKLEERLLELREKEASDAAKAAADQADSYLDYLEDTGTGKVKAFLENFYSAITPTMDKGGTIPVGEDFDWDEYASQWGNSRDKYLQSVTQGTDDLAASVQYAIGEYKDLEEQVKEADKELAKNPDSKYWQKYKENAESSLADVEKYILDNEDAVLDYIDTWQRAGENEDLIDEYMDLVDAINTMDMSALEELQNYELDTFFARKDTDNSIKDALQEAADSGEDLQGVLDSLGLTLDDLGSHVTLDSLEAYFKEAGTYIPQSLQDIAKSMNIDLSDVLQFEENPIDYTNYMMPDEVIGSWNELQNGMEAYSDGQKKLASDSSFTKYINNYISDVNKLTDAYKKLQDGSLSASDEAALRDEFQELSQYSGDLDDQIRALIGDMQTDVISEFSDQINSVDSEEAREQLYQLMDAVLELGNLTDDFDFDIDVEIEGVDNLTSALNDSASAAGLTSEEIANLKARYQDLDGYDPSKLFEETTNGIHLNAQALQDLEAEYQSQNFNDINGQLEALMNQYQNLSQEIENCSDSSKRSELYAERDSIKNEIENVAQLAAQYDGLTSSYNQWINAQSTTDEDSMYNNISNSLDDIKQLYEDGRVGADDFRTAVQMMTDVDLSTASIDELIAVYESGMDTMERFFTGNAEGLQDFLDTALEVSDALGENWITLDDQGNYQFDFGVGGDEELAAAMSDLEGIQMSAEEVQIILRALSTYGFDINLDSPYTQFMNLKTAAEEYGEVLNEITGTDYTFNVNSDSLEDVNDQIGELKEIINDNDFIVDGEFNMDVEGAEEAEGLMEALYEQKEALSAEVVMNIDTSGMEGDVYDTVRLLQDTLSAYSNYQMDVDLELNTAESEAQLGELVSEIESLDAKTTADLGLNDAEFQAALSTIDANIEAGAELDPGALSTIESTIAGIEAEALVEFGVDSVLVDEYVASEHDSTGTVKWDNETSLVDAYASTVKSATGVVKWSEDTSGVTTVFHATGTVKINQEVSSSSSSNSSSSSAKSSKSSSTSRANGTANAYAAGTDVTVGEDGEAIVNELGEEGLIRNGILTRIQGGLQKIFLRAGDIILNHRQLEELDKNGMVTSDGGRGELIGNFLKGTMKAFSSGSGAFKGGASSSGSSTSSTTKTTTTTTTKTTSSGNTSSSSSSSKSTSTSSSSKSSSSSSTSSKDFEDTMDWIEIKIDRIERAIDSLDLKMSSTYKTWSTRNSALSDELSKITDEITIQQQAYDRYIQQANSVGLSSTYAEKVRNGTIDISTITDEDLYDKIQEYQKWYEKALDCQEAIENLQETEAKLYRTSFDYVQKQYEELLDVIEFNMDMLDEAINQTEEHGYIVSTKYYDALISQEQDNIKQLEKEQAALLDSLNAAISSGSIKTYSEEWYRKMPFRPAMAG